MGLEVNRIPLDALALLLWSPPLVLHCLLYVPVTTFVHKAMTGSDLRLPTYGLCLVSIILYTRGMLASGQANIVQHGYSQSIFARMIPMRQLVSSHQVRP